MDGADLLTKLRAIPAPDAAGGSSSSFAAAGIALAGAAVQNCSPLPAAILLGLNLEDMGLERPGVGASFLTSRVAAPPQPW